MARAEGWDVRVAAPAEEVEAAVVRASGEPLDSFVRRLAQAKAAAIVATGATGVVLACDTLAELEGDPLGKPLDRTDARRMLMALSGREHRVVSGVCLWQRPGGEPVLAHAESVLEMDRLTDEFLDWYLDSGLWRGKAGACGFQDERLPLRLVAGSPSNVVGLPLELIRAMIANLDRLP